MSGMAIERILHIQALSFAYPGLPALASQWSATIPAGITLLLGDTGSGKTTLLRLLAGTAPVDGRLTLGGIRFDAEPAAYRRAVFWQEPGSDVFDQQSPRQIVATLHSDRPGFDLTAWAHHADAFALGPHLDKPLYMLSTGSKRKVWLTMALASCCPLTLLDEPFGALDAPSIAHLRRALAEASTQRDRALIVASSEVPGGVPLSGRIELPLNRRGA